MMPRWNRQTPHAPIAAPRIAAGLCSSGAARPHRFGQRQFVKSFIPNLQKACCTNSSRLLKNETGYLSCV